MSPSARSTEELGSGFTSVKRCAAAVGVATTLLGSCIGLERERRRGLLRPAGLLAFAGRLLRRQDDHLHALVGGGRRSRRRAGELPSKVLVRLASSAVRWSAPTTISLSRSALSASAGAATRAVATIARAAARISALSP